MSLETLIPPAEPVNGGPVAEQHTGIDNSNNVVTPDPNVSQQPGGENQQGQVKTTDAPSQFNPLDHLTRLSTVAGIEFSSVDEVEKWVASEVKAKTEMPSNLSQPLFQELAKFVGDAGDAKEALNKIAEYAKTLSTDYRQLATTDPDQVLMASYRQKYPGMSEAHIKSLIQNEFPIVGEDEVPDDALRQRQNDLTTAKKIKAAIENAEGLTKSQIEWKNQAIADKDPVADFNKILDTVRGEIKTAFQNPELGKIKIGDHVHVVELHKNGAFTEAGKVVNAFYNNPYGEHGLGRWMTEDGAPKVQQIMSDLLKLTNMESVAKTYASKQVSVANDTIINEVTNHSNPAGGNNVRPSDKKPTWRG